MGAKSQILLAMSSLVLTLLLAAPPQTAPPLATATTTPVMTASSTTSTSSTMASAPSESADDAVREALRAADEARWCDAAAWFERAYASAPSPGVLLQAALAVARAGDLGAAQAFLDLELALPSSSEVQREEARRHAALLADRIARDGAGPACPAPAPAAPTSAPRANTATTMTTMTTTTTTTRDTGAVAAPARPPAPGLVSPPLAAAHDDGDSDSEQDAAAWWPAAVAVAAGGAVALAVGALPWFEHARLGDELRAAEAKRTDGRALNDAQQQARTSWETWGLPLSVAGWSATTLGVAGVVAASLLPPTSTTTTAHTSERQR